MDFEQDTVGAAELQPGRLALPSEPEVDQHELTHVPFRNWCWHYMRAKGKESPHHESSPAACRSSPQTACSWAEDGTPITILAGCDGLTKAFFANVVFAKFESWLRRKSSRAQRASHRSSQSDTAQGLRTEHHRRQPQSWHAHSNRNRERRAQLDTATATASSIEPTKLSKDRSVQSRSTLNDRSVRR